MKFYEAEMRAFDFMEGWHTLREWAEFGFNKVVYNDTEYWDGLRDGNYPITDEEVKEAGDLALDYYDYDYDGYMYVVLKNPDELGTLER